MTLITPSKAVPVNVGEGTTVKLVRDPNPNDTIRFDCLRCGSCCEYYIELVPKESRRIANHLKLGNQEFLDSYTFFRENEKLGGGIYLNHGADGDKCVFYGKENGKGQCKINIVKPQRCVTMPLLSLYINGTSPEVYVKPCRGLGRGEERTIDEWKKKAKFNEMLNTDAAYIKQLEEIARTTPRGKIKERITELFL